MSDISRAGFPSEFWAQELHHGHSGNTTTTLVSGVGTGSGIAVDPGTPQAIDSNLKTPRASWSAMRVTLRDFFGGQR
jgi:hypothetical protein